MSFLYRLDRRAKVATRCLKCHKEWSCLSLQLAPLLALAIERQGQGVALGERRDLLGIERGYQTIRQQPSRSTDRPSNADPADSADELAGGQRRGALSRLISALLK